MKTNFKPSKTVAHDENFKPSITGDKRDFTEKEFEEFIENSGAVGSFMVFRSEKKDSEMGIDNL
jgi:hypothetical protein